mmetsp:Transcript_17064/g.40121  ORF Transcript_17064/g.40121 Transcript_17064/m.40121 type:complete len:210 (-) Transcript_17064:839-1468(-)
MLDSWEIQAFGRHIGAYQNILGALFEGLDGLVALLLVQAAMDGHHLHAFEQEVLVHIIHVRLVLAEDQHRRWSLLQALEQVHQLCFLLDVFDFLDDIQVGRTSATHVDDYGIDQRRLGKVLDLPWHGGAEKQRLALPAEVVQSVADLLFKAKVHHSIGLIHHEVLALCHGEPLFGQQIVESPWCCNDHVRAPPERCCLGPRAEAAYGEH